MEITIKPEDVDKLVRDAILTAGIGKVITEQVTAALKSPYTRDGFVEGAVKAYVERVCGEIIREGFGEQIKAAVTVQVQEKVTPAVIEKLSQEAVEKLVSAAELRRNW